MNLYNEIDPFAAQWLRNLIAAGHIAPGVVDERSIVEIQPEELREFTQVHLFAGIGVWSHALRLAGWPDDRPVWTGSCPCQPFSAAGKRKGINDERHLWPHYLRLLKECRPAIVLGEQVASKDGLGWIDTVRADLEGAGYAFGSSDLCAAGIGAPHIRQRLWFVGVGVSGGARAGRDTGADDRAEGEGAGCGRATGRECNGLQLAGTSGGVGQPDGQRREKLGIHLRGRRPLEGLPEAAGDGNSGPGPVNGFWHPADWVLCRDPGGPRWRPVEPGSFPLADGAPSRVGRLRAYGNAIVAPLAQAWIEAVMESIP